MKRLYYAHTAKDRAEDAWESLLRHLTEVAALAAERGERFGAGALAHAAGLLHDVLARIEEKAALVAHFGNLEKKWRVDRRGRDR